MKFVIRLLLSIGFFLKLAPGFAAEKPNIVFILTDNQGAWQLGCYGNPDSNSAHRSDGERGSSVHKRLCK